MVNGQSYTSQCLEPNKKKRRWRSTLDTDIDDRKNLLRDGSRTMNEYLFGIATAAALRDRVRLRAWRNLRAGKQSIARELDRRWAQFRIAQDFLVVDSARLNRIVSI
jgi:hypothetical protein